MKKIILLSMIVPAFCIAQSDSIAEPEIQDGVLISSSGFKVQNGDYLTLGTGSTPDGDYKFVRVNQNSMFARGRNKDNDLNRRFVNRKFKVVKTLKRGSKKHGYSYVAVINIGITRYEVDVDNAIAAGEIIVPDEFRPKNKALQVEVKQNISIADELLKFKKLRDDSLITEEEYQVQKKKLLNQ